MSLAVQSETSSPSFRTISSRVLGECKLPNSAFFHFPEGIHGFEEYQEFALVATGKEGFWYLQSSAEPGLAFLLADPFPLFEGYEVDIGQGDTRFLGLESSDQTLVLCVVTLPSSGNAATANLRGPIVLNTQRRVGRQIVSTLDGYGTQVELAIG